MGIQVSENTLRIRDIAGKGESVSFVKFHAELPEAKANISRVLSVRGRPKVTGSRVEAGKVMFEGRLSFDVLYVPQNTGELAYDLVEKAEFKDAAEFEYFVDVEEAGPGDEPVVKTFLQSVDFDVDGRFVYVDASLRHEVLVFRSKTIKFLGDIATTPPEKVKMDKREILLEEYAGSTQKTTSIGGTVSLPLGVLRLVDVTVKPVIKREIADPEGITLIGSLDLTLLAVRELGDTAAVQTITLPAALAFEERIEIMLQDNILSRSQIGVDYVSYARVDNELKLDVGLSIKTELTSPRRVSLVIDAESVAGRRIVTRTGTVGIKRKVVSAPSKTTAESLLRLPEGLVEPAEVLMVQITPNVEKAEWAGNALQVEGTCSMEFVYTGVDAELHSVFWEDILDFSTPVDFSGLEEEAEVVGIEVTTEFFRHQILDGSMEVTTGLTILAEVAAPENVTCILEAMANDDIVEKPAYLTFVTVEEDDSLWKLAQKYRTSSDVIMEDNGLVSEDLTPGQKLIIRRAKSVK